MKFRREVRGCSVREVTNELYNSNIINLNNKLIDLTNQYISSKKSITSFINDLIQVEKDSVFFVNIEKPVLNINKYRAKIVNNYSIGRKKWYLKYAVYGEDQYKYIDRFDDKDKAIQYAMNYTEKTRINTEIRAEKELAEGSPVLAEIKYNYAYGEREGLWVFFSK